MRQRTSKQQNERQMRELTRAGELQKQKAVELTAVRVLDLADLLTSKKGNVDEMAEYCNHGVASHGMKEEDD